MQQAELQIKAQDVQRKAQKDQVDGQIAQQRLALDAQRIQAENAREQARLLAANKANEQKIKADVITKLTGR
jgi:hypothetical protein